MVMVVPLAPATGQPALMVSGHLQVGAGGRRHGEGAGKGWAQAGAAPRGRVACGSPHCCPAARPAARARGAAHVIEAAPKTQKRGRALAHQEKKMHLESPTHASAHFSTVSALKVGVICGSRG